jgi:hypothetical protein
MNVKLMLGIVIFLFGLVMAIVGIAGVGQPTEVQQPTALADEANRGAVAERSSNVAVPLLAGLSLAIGGLLIGLSMGNWRNPRTHSEPGDKVVNPEGHQKMKHV